MPNLSTKPQRPKPQRDTRALVLEAAYKLLIEEGAQSFSMRKVAQGAEISLGNLQYHFATRNELVHALFDRIAERVLIAVEAQDTGQARIFSIIDAIFAELDTPHGSIPVWELCSLAAHDEALAEMLHNLFRPFREELARHIRTVDPGRPRAMAEHQATCIVALIEGSGWFDAYGRANREEFKGLRQATKKLIHQIIETPL